jgi:hypothetical protein
MLSFRHGPPPPMRFHRAGRVTSSSPNHRQGQFRVSPTPARPRSPTPSAAGPHPPQLNTSDPTIGPFPTAPTKLHAPAMPKEWSHQAAATGSAHPAPFLERVAGWPLAHSVGCSRAISALSRHFFFLIFLHVDKLKVLRSTGAAAWKAHIHTVAEAVHMCCRENHKRNF